MSNDRKSYRLALCSCFFLCYVLLECIAANESKYGIFMAIRNFSGILFAKNILFYYFCSRFSVHGGFEWRVRGSVAQLD